MIQPSRRPLRRHSRVPASATRQRGVVAILLAVIAVAAAGAAFGNFMLRRMNTSQADIQGQQAVLRWADHAVRGYALMNKGNLPCPASTRNGPANCGQGLKGWLPIKSLVQATGGEPPPEHVMLDIRYIVNRNALASGPSVTPLDFTEFVPVFAPALIDGSPVYPPSDDTRSTMDLCATLRDINGVFTNELGEVKRWRIAADQPALAPNVTLAPGQLVYGVAVAAAGASFEASGVNASLAVPAIESPLQPVDQTYTDLVTEDDVAQGSGSETKGLTLTGRGNLDVEVGPVLTTGATIRALQASLLQQDAGAEQLTAANSDESEWHALIDESERRLAIALAQLEASDEVTSGRRSDHALPDLELDLLLDIDLVDLETSAWESGGVQRHGASLHAEHVH